MVCVNSHITLSDTPGGCSDNAIHDSKGTVENTLCVCILTHCPT